MADSQTDAPINSIEGFDIDKIQSLVEKISNENDDGYVDAFTDEDYASIYKMKDVHAFIRLILQRFGTLTLYVIEPYIEQNAGEALKIPANDNYSIYDYGGRVVISANDIYATSLFACAAFLKAIEQTLQILIDIGATEIAILGDQRAKLFIWDRCDRLKTFENIPISVINFNPPESFGITSAAVRRYLEERGMKPVTKPQVTPAA